MSNKFLGNTFLDFDLKHDPGTVKRLKSLAELFDIEPDNARAALDLLQMGKKARIIDEDEFKSDWNRICPHYLKECDRVKREEWLRKEREEDEELERRRQKYVEDYDQAMENGKISSFEDMKKFREENNK